MTPPQDLTDDLLMQYSANAAYAALKDEGYKPSMMHLHERLRQLIADGRRMPISHSERGSYSNVAEVLPGASLEGSEKLLAACLRMYERKANRMGTTMEEAMLTTLYAPGDMVKWRAAA